MSAPSAVIAKILETKLVGTLNEAMITPTLWVIKFGRRVESPSKQIVLTDTGGSNPNTKYQLDFVHVQALVRGEAYEYVDTYSKAVAVKDACLGIDSQDVSVGSVVTRVDGITMNGDIAFLRYDETERPLFSVNLRIIMEREPNALSNRDSL